MKHDSGRILAMGLVWLALALAGCDAQHRADDPTIGDLALKGLRAEMVSLTEFAEGRAPQDFARRAGASYKPSFNPDPAIPPQCWIETGYGTQNACIYCHTNHLAVIGHGNALWLAEDQILYSFDEPELNHVLWRNVIAPEEISARLEQEGVAIPDIDDTDYVRRDNWAPAFARARTGEGRNWMNTDRPDDEFALFPALDPNHLFPYDAADPTSGGTHGYVDPEGFVRNAEGHLTGWRSINFFPYGIFTPLTGSVSGIYIRLPRIFMTEGDVKSIEIYKANLDLLERNIKNRLEGERHYFGDASDVPVQRGFYPVGTQFAHPLHYVDLKADGQAGPSVDGVVGNAATTYEFPGTRAKRLKEMRFMYKWRDVSLDDLAEAEDEDEEPETVIGREGQGWIENGGGWILAAFIEDRQGNLRTQTTEELMQCLGCHGNVGNTVDAVWSFQRRLPGDAGWREMDYGRYDARRPHETRLQDYRREGEDRGEFEFFYHTVVGADLYGVMPREIASELMRHARENDLERRLSLAQSIEEIFDDEALKNMGADKRKSRLRQRQAIMRDYAARREYLVHDRADDCYYVKGTVFYPREETMKANILLYRKIVLDQSYNLGKDVFGTESGHIPFTFRSDGNVRDAEGRVIPAGAIITSRPYDEDGVGTMPTGIVAVNADGIPIDGNGDPVDIDNDPERAVGHISTGGTFFTLYDPILGDVPVRKEED
jgi:hypothetical protein